MKLKLKPLVIALASIGLSTTVFAANNSQAELVTQLKAVNQEMQQMQRQMTSLQHQVSTLKSRLNQRPSKRHASASARVKYTRSPVNSNIKPGYVYRHHTTTFIRGSHPTYAEVASLMKNNTGKPETAAERRGDRKVEQLLPEYRLIGDSVIIAPFTGVPTYFNGHQLVVNAPSINEDVKLMERRHLAEAVMHREDRDMPRPHLVLSGALEGIAAYLNPYAGGSSSDIDLTDAQLDTYIDVSRWVSGFMAFDYEDSRANFSANRIDNSRVQLDKAFITIGNLARSPFYGSIGQMYVPFGRYGSSMIDSPLTEFIGKTKARAIDLGYRPLGPNEPYAVAYAFNGVSGNSVDQVRNVGADVGYHFTDGKAHGDAGVSYINNIGNAIGMQGNGRSTGFTGFNESGITEKLKHFVPGGDVYGTASYGPFSFLGEYVTALRGFSPFDMTYDGHGARPSAFNTELVYTFHLFNLPGSFAVGYAQTREALALNLPRVRYDTSLELAILRNTILSFEIRHDINYSTGSAATGKGMTAVTTGELGHSDDAAIAQLALYF